MNLFRRASNVPSKNLKYFKGRSDQQRLAIRRSLLFSGVAIGIGSLYYISHLENVPYSGRSRFMTISSANEKHIGDQEYQLLLRKYSNRILPKSHKISIFVRNIAQRIINANHLSGVWDVTIIDDPTPNAFVIPGGKIFVFTGILPLIADEDGMAAILGHEMVIRH